MDYTISNIAPIMLFPFLGFVIGCFLVSKWEKFTAALCTLSIFGSFIYAARIFKDFVFGVYSSDYYIHKTFTWFDLGPMFKLNLGIYLDNMGAVALFMVTGAAFLIHLFSTYYMGHDERYGRFMVYLNLFTMGMLGVVLSDNLFSFFMFWELMGFCSYSLIGFYYEKEAPGNASLKAFMTTRVGDVFFLLGLCSLWYAIKDHTGTGSFALVDFYNYLADGAYQGKTLLGMNWAAVTGFLFFMGTIGKSAQFPLQVWLPDAMQGPTPCSALIHAATMVAAGVYLSLRVFPLLEAGGLLPVIAYIGGITAFGAATIALIQTDLKAVLAYSTISQLGYMVLGIGVMAYNPSFMHLITHAVFKACLFLSAGSVIHSLHDHHTHGHVQEMPRMGGLRKKLPLTFLAMMCCTLAIAGVPLFSGFVSKDRILGDALLMALDHPVYWGPAILGFAAAFLTAFYMFRMMFLTFFGEPRDKDVYDHCEQEKLSFNRNVPLLILTVFTFGFWYSGSFSGQGLVKVPGVENKEWFQTLIERPDLNNLSKFKTYSSEPFSSIDLRDKSKFVKSTYDPTYGLSEEKAHHVHYWHYVGAIASIIIAFSGIFLAYLMYIKKSVNPGWWVNTFSRWYRALQNLYYMDHFYIKVLLQKGLLKFNNFLAWIDMSIHDKYLIDGWEKVNRVFYRISKRFDDIAIDTISVDGVGASVRFFNVILRTIQSGKIQFYFIVILLVLFSYMMTLNIG